MSATPRHRKHHLVVVVPDTHHCHQDVLSLRALMRMIAERKPDTIIQLGDNIDGYAVSRFVKDPDEVNGLQQEFDECALFWARMRSASPGARLVQIEGNHEERWQNFLWSNAPQVSSLRGLTINHLMRLSESGVEWWPRNQKFWLIPQKLLITHGNQTNGKAGYAAHNELDKRWCNGITGHVHRIGQVFRTTEIGTFTWCEAGHLVDVEKVGYLRGGVGNWQQGFVAVYLYGRDQFHIQPVPVLKHGFVFEGRLYSPDDVRY